jgi:hypothetical protein
MNTSFVTITCELSDDQALALAQFVKRVGWSEFRANAVDDDEAATIRSAVDALQKALGEAGYAPR